MAMSLAHRPEPRNPLDLIEEIINAHDWPFDRMGADELAAEYAGHWCTHHLQFLWSEELHAMHLSCVMGMSVPGQRRNRLYELLALVNPRVWLGHFDLSGNKTLPVFRYAILLKGTAGVSVEQLEELIDIALAECERFYPAFQYVLWGGKSAEEAVEAALIDTQGEA